MVEIDFVVAGISKCGTTTLCSMLGQHPDIFIPEEKEPWYFSSENYEQRHDYYNDLFKNAAPHQKWGEGSTSYTGYASEGFATQRLLERCPDCRFIFITRNPIKRIESSFREMHHSAQIFGMSADFKLGSELIRSPQIIEDTLYFQRLDAYRKVFPAEALKILFLEDYYAAPAKVIKECFEHIGVDASFAPNTSVQLNKGSDKLQDTKLLRFLRRLRIGKTPLVKFYSAEHDEQLRKLGLRVLSDKKIKWDDTAKRLYNERVLPDSQRFLESCGKDANFWNLDID